VQLPIVDFMNRFLAALEEEKPGFPPFPRFGGGEDFV
jgi:hypothetical protein